MTSPTALYKIAPIPNAGLGVIATAPISRGTLVLSEPPLFTLTADFKTIAAATIGITSKLCSLTPTQQQIFSALSNSHGSDLPPVMGVVKTNAHPLGVDASECGIFPDCSRFNHSCTPNANYCWNPDIGEETVYAIQEIAEGEQITVTYLDEEAINLPRESRRKKLKGDFRFDCACNTCAASAGEIATSDTRRRTIGVLSEVIGRGSMVMSNPARALEFCRRILKLLEDEGINDISLYRTYYDALQICAMHGDMARASAFAALAVQVKIMCHGSDAAGTEEVRPYVECPEKHRLAGMSARWRTKAKDVKEIGSEGFEAWLWSRAS